MSKPPKVVEAEITEDGSIIIHFNQAFMPSIRRALFEPEALLALAEEYAVMPRPDETDFPGIPLVSEEDVFADEEDRGAKRNGVIEPEIVRPDDDDPRFVPEEPVEEGD